MPIGAGHEGDILKLIRLRLVGLDHGGAVQRVPAHACNGIRYCVIRCGVVLCGAVRCGVVRGGTGW